MWRVAVQNPKRQKTMKLMIARIAPLVLVGILPVWAETTTEKTTDVTKNADGSVTKTQTKTTTFNPEAR